VDEVDVLFHDPRVLHRENTFRQRQLWQHSRDPWLRSG
jgi:hypothetical protein